VSQLGLSASLLCPPIFSLPFSRRLLVVLLSGERLFGHLEIGADLDDKYCRLSLAHVLKLICTHLLTLDDFEYWVPWVLLFGGDQLHAFCFSAFP